MPAWFGVIVPPIPTGVTPIKGFIPDPDFICPTPIELLLIPIPGGPAPDFLEPIPMELDLVFRVRVRVGVRVRVRVEKAVDKDRVLIEP
jgi:hypothetical protein